MWWGVWELQDGSAPSPSQGTAQHRAFHSGKFSSDSLSLQLQGPALGCGQDREPGAHFGREERTLLIPPSLCRHFYFPVCSGTSSLVFLPALLLLLGLWDELVYPNLLQFVNLPAPGPAPSAAAEPGKRLKRGPGPDSISRPYLQGSSAELVMEQQRGGVAPSADPREEQ